MVRVMVYIPNVLFAFAIAIGGFCILAKGMEYLLGKEDFPYNKAGAMIIVGILAMIGGVTLIPFTVTPM